MLENRWKDSVHDQIFVYLERAIERKISSICKSPYIPTSGSRTILKKRYNKNNVAIWDEIKLEGLELSRSTAKKDLDKTDCFWFDCVLGLTDNERLAVIVYADPFNEFSEKDLWIDFLEESGFKNNRTYNLTLGRAVFKLQKLAEERNLVRKMDEDELKSWREIADYWRVSIPTMMKLAKQMKLPIILLEGNVYCLKSKLDEYRSKLYNDDSNMVWNQKKKGKKNANR